MPGLFRLDSGSDIPLVVSRRWVKEAGREAEISTDFKSPSSYSLSGHAMKFSGIVRNLVFNPKGSSTIYRRDFLVCDRLDSFVPVEQAEAQLLKDNQDKEAQKAELRRQDKKDVQRAREKEARRKQQDTNKSLVSQ
ncbi:hypothetical protein ACHAPF_006395 [Botrytis cinerea]